MEKVSYLSRIIYVFIWNEKFRSKGDFYRKVVKIEGTGGEKKFVFLVYSIGIYYL